MIPAPTHPASHPIAVLAGGKKNRSSIMQIDPNLPPFLFVHLVQNFAPYINGPRK
jgi:hypothetical protein